jgi:hypothetical protein
MIVSRRIRVGPSALCGIDSALSISCGPGRDDRIDTNGWPVHASCCYGVGRWRDFGENVHSRGRSLICTISTTSCAPEVSAQPFISMGWHVGQPRGACSLPKAKYLRLAFLSRGTNTNLTSAVLPCVVWLELAPSLLPCMAENSTPPLGFVRMCSRIAASHRPIQTPVLQDLSLMSPCGHVVQDTPDSEVVHDVNRSSITILA